MRLFKGVLGMAVLLVSMAVMGFAQEQKPVVAVSIPPQVSILKQIAGDNVSIVCLLPKGSDPHSYDPSPDTIKAFSKAKIWFKVGSGLEFEDKWEKALLKQNPNVKVVNTSEGLEIADKDPHVWLLPRNVIIIALNMAKPLLSEMPDKKEEMMASYTKYMNELIEVDKSIMEAMKQKKIKAILSDKPAWGYFEKGYKITVLPLFSSGRQVSGKGLKQIIDKSKEMNVKYILISRDGSSYKAVKTIIKRLKLKQIKANPLAEDLLQEFRSISKALKDGEE